MKRTIVAALAAFAVMFSGLAAAAPAQATFGDSRACVTAKEYRAIKKGQSKAKVKRILDGRGKKINAKTRQYRQCGTTKQVRVTYNKAYGNKTAKVARKAIVTPRPPAASGGSYAPINKWDCPTKAPIKGNESSMIYHKPGQRYYDATTPEQCFATDRAARAAGFRAAKV